MTDKLEPECRDKSILTVNYGVQVDFAYKLNSEYFVQNYGVALNPLYRFNAKAILLEEQ